MFFFSFSLALNTLLGSSVVYAHVPHDNIYDIAVPLDLDPTKHWMFAGYQAISDSYNGGDDWQMTGGMPLIDELISAALLDDGTTLFLGEGRLWWTMDEGLSYDYAEIDGLGLGLEAIGNNIAVLTSEGLQFGTLDGIIGKEAVAFSYTINANYMKASDMGISIISDAGATWSIPADLPTLISLTENPEPITPTSSVMGGSVKNPVTYVGDAEGRVWKQTNDVWSQCGALPNTEHSAVVELEVDGTRVFAAPASNAPFLSIDECATWEDHRIPTEIEFNNSGGADSDQAAFTVLRVRGDTWLVGGWSGLWRSLNNGVDWESITVIPADFTRGIAFSQNFPSDQTVYIGAYAAGIQITNDGGLSFTSPNWGIGQTNVQRIRTTKGDPNRISSIAAHFAYLSDDAGQNWRQLDDPFSMDRHVFSYVEPKELWVYGKKPEDGFDGLIAYSLDDGDTFSELTALNALMPSDPEYILRYHNKLNTLTYMATGIDGIFTADGPEGPWTKIGTLLGGSGGGAPVVWPEEAPERAMVAKGGSVHMSFDGGLTWKTSHLLDSLASISSTLFASDGTAFAVTETGRLFRSDTGEVWTEMITDVPYMHEHRSIIPAQVYEAQARPDFHKFREILLGTHDGVYVVTDSEPPTISRWSGWQRVDNKADFVYCNGCPEGLSEPNNEPYPGADFSAISRIREGIEMGVQLRGHTITLSGVILEESQVDVYVDGTLIESIGQDISLDPDTMETLITIEDLDDGWHHLTVEGIAGEGVLIDTFSSLTEASPLQVFEEPTETAETGHTGKSTTQTGTTDTSDSGPTETDSPPDDGSACGCASTTTQFLWLSLLTPLLILRRCKI